MTLKSGLERRARLTERLWWFTALELGAFGELEGFVLGFGLPKVDPSTGSKSVWTLEFLILSLT